VEPCVTADTRVPPIRRARADIRPEETTSALVPGRAVSPSSVHALAARPSAEDVRPCRRQARMGHGTPPDGADMPTRMTAMTAQAPHAVTRQPRHHPWAAAAPRHSAAMRLAHSLCVDTRMQAGGPGRIEAAARDRGLDGLAASMRARSATNGVASPRRTQAFLPWCVSCTRPSTRGVCPMQTA